LVKGSEIIRGLRGSLAEAGVGPLDAHREMIKAILTSGNVLGQKVRLVDVLPSAKSLPDTSPALLFTGCVVSSSYPHIAEALIQILTKAGCNFTVMKNGEDCCGKFLDLLGLAGESSKLVAKNWSVFSEMNVRDIFTVCPFCYGAFLHSVPKDQSISVQHSTQILLNLLTERRIRFNRKLDANVAYFDPCHLGRYEKIYDAPRSVVRAIPGVTLVEMDKSKHLSRCCGGTIRVPYFDIRTGMSEAIAKSANDAGADYLVTGCPTCYHNLKFVALDYDVRVCSIEELAGYSMGLVKEISE